MMNRYKLELDKLTVPENAVKDLMVETGRHRRKMPRYGMALAACLAVLCCLSIVAVARAYTGWRVSEPAQFNSEEYLAEHDQLSSSAAERIRERDGYYEVYATTGSEAFTFEPAVLSFLTEQAFQEEQCVYYRSLAEMNEALRIRMLDSAMLIPMEGELLRLIVSPLDGEGSHLQVLGEQTLLVAGSEDVCCHYSFDVYTCEGQDTRVSILQEEDTFSFSQMELEALRVTAEVITFAENERIMVCFTKDGIPYKFMFYLRENAAADEVDRELVQQVLGSLK